MNKTLFSLSISLLLSSPSMAERPNYDISDKPPEFKPLTDDFGFTIIEKNEAFNEEFETTDEVYEPTSEAIESNIDFAEPASEVEQESESGWNTFWQAIGFDDDNSEDELVDESIGITDDYGDSADGLADESTGKTDIYSDSDEVLDHEPIGLTDSYDNGTKEPDHGYEDDIAENLNHESTDISDSSSDEIYEPVKQVEEVNKEVSEPKDEVIETKDEAEHVSETRPLIIKYHDDHNPEDHVHDHDDHNPEDHDHDDPESLDHQHKDPRAHEKQIEAAKKNAARQYEKFDPEDQDQWWPF